MTLLVPARRPLQPRPGLRAAALSGAAAASLLVSGAAAALGLGDLVQQSALGEPFRAAIRVIADADDVARGELSPECFRSVGPDAERSGGLPSLAFGRATLTQGADGFQLIIASDAVASQPALSFAVDAGCRLRVHREYTALLDPPARTAIAAPVSALGTTPTARSAPPASAVRRSTAAMNSPVVLRGRRGPSSAAKIAASDPRAASVGSARKADATRLRRETAPRLRVSRSTDAGADPAGHRKTDAEIRQEVEAETIVLQRRIAELSVTLAQLDEELRVARAARDAAERRSSVAASPPRAIEFWLIPALLVAVGLALIVMILRALRKPTLRSIGLSALVASTLGPAQSERLEAVPKHGSARVPPAPLPDDLDASLQPEAAEPPRHDDEASFEDDLIRYAEQRAAYSVLEREQPKVVAAIVREWGRPKAIAYLRDLLVAPRKPGRAFSREAVSDLMFLQALAMQRAGYRADDHPWRIDPRVQRRA